MIGMLITQIKDASLSGKIQVDAKKRKKAFNLEMKLKAMGMDVPISLVGSLDNEGKEPKTLFSNRYDGIYCRCRRLND